jgi:hypothetical protein
MSVYKPFNTSDILISPLELNKTFSYTSLSEVTGSGLDIFIGKNIPQSPFIPNSNNTGYIKQQDSYLVYESIKHLYYSNFLEDMDGSPATKVIFNNDGTITGNSPTTNFDNYLTTTLNAHRVFPTGSGEEIAVLSIPSNVFGENIKPNTFLWSSQAGEITDDNEGRLYYTETGGAKRLIGNIIYEHGIIILDLELFYPGDLQEGYGFVSYGIPNPPFPTGIYGGVIDSFLNFLNDLTLLKFKSSITTYELQYKCNIRENEFNYTHNPTIITGSVNEGNVKPFAQQSYFSPYVTSIGLHNNEGELLGVAKLSQPLPTSPTTDTNIIINLDL